MQTHIAASKSAMIVVNGEQIEGDSIRCPYHGWRFGPDGQCDDIPYHDGPIPRSAKLGSYEVREVMGCIMMWWDPEGGAPEYEPPMLPEWNDPTWMHWQLDHLGELELHGLEILDNMADAQHLGPTHGAPCEYFENEFKDHLYIQRQGGMHHGYGAYLRSSTWYTGPGILLSKQDFGGAITFELIANTPVDDGVSKVWHAALAQAQSMPHSAEDLAMAKQVQEGALAAFGADFDVWRHKKSAIKVMQIKSDGPFNKGRKWYSQFYDIRANAGKYQSDVNGLHYIENGKMEKPNDEAYALDEGISLGV
jgi:3-ketosteroid 9alpha-monooxygenase subunit A